MKKRSEPAIPSFPYPVTHTRGPSELLGRYIYCVAWARGEMDLGELGIEGSRVYPVRHKDLCAVVHDCPSQPYESQNRDVVAAWVLAHHRVVETAWKKWGMVLPMTFNTIIAGGEQSAEENLKAWLNGECQVLKGKLEALTGKAEFGVQVFWDPTTIAKRVAETSPEIRKLEEEIKSKPKGLAYMYRQKLERLLRKGMETNAAEESRSFFGTISPLVNNINVEKIATSPEGRPMLMNLSCLVTMEKFHPFETTLNQISAKEGFFIRLVGPLPPYSFC